MVAISPRLENPNIYTDLGGLNQITRLGRENTAAGLKKVAQQFESLFLNMMLKSMRDSNAVFSEGNYLSSNEMEFHQQNYDNQLSLHLSESGGFGLADVLYRQMMRQFGIKEETGEETSSAPLASARHPVTGKSAADIKSPEDFVRKLYHLAEGVASRIGVDPKVLLAQSALETGWGQKMIKHQQGENSHNLFGIKADERWDGDSAVVSTLEYRDGVAHQEKARFRAYDSYEQSFDDYVNYLQANPRYEDALRHASNPEMFARKLQEAGYATDPIYAEKIQRVMNSDTMKVALKQIGKNLP